MTPELKAAEERLRRLESGESINAVYADFLAADRMAYADVDYRRLARAYLAEHQADYDEPVSEEWLKSIGFDESLIIELSGKWSLLAYTHSDWALDIENSPNDYYGCEHSYDIPQPKTRDEVRRLLETLGIPCKEQT